MGPGNDWQSLVGLVVVLALVGGLTWFYDRLMRPRDRRRYRDHADRAWRKPPHDMT